MRGVYIQPAHVVTIVLDKTRCCNTMLEATLASNAAHDTWTFAHHRHVAQGTFYQQWACRSNVLVEGKLEGEETTHMTT